ncbi:MAG TPA: alternative ribosome rescue aminoacyl-tRNA hydrolase ArfB [Acidimicrobiales bacterium]|nr:alternative ribosome rescue aminoacyl-tRNA hydrolase ArfB [Acidimicrobiales bacterium]
MDVRDLDLGDGVVVPGSEIEWRFSASGGPGGQHANRANTRAEARLDLVSSPSLAAHPGVQRRLQNRLGAEVSVTVDDERSQARNRSIALHRLEERLRSALVLRKARRKTKPSRGSQRRRVDQKKQRGELKRQRRRPSY